MSEHVREGHMVIVFHACSSRDKEKNQYLEEFVDVDKSESCLRKEKCNEHNDRVMKEHA